jgi:Xaa-Pro aminopeptidase
MTRAEAGLPGIIKEEKNLVKATARMIAELVKGDIVVPLSFPFGLAHELEAFGRVIPDNGTVESLREIKSPGEIEHIRRVQAATELAMDLAISLIRASVPKDGVLCSGSETLTSEQVRAAMHKLLLDHGCIATDTIVACGEDAALPHFLGSGPLREAEPIVIDVFPQDMMTGYYTDMTRTVSKGRPDQENIEMYQAVKEAQSLGQSLMKPGITGESVHQAVIDFFRERGYESNTRGFVHNLGHGVGLEVHELPVIGPGGPILRPGQVVTVEPGLYYPGTGGVRLEDTGAIMSDGFQNFTRYPREFVL